MRQPEKDEENKEKQWIDGKEKPFTYREENQCKNYLIYLTKINIDTENYYRNYG